MKTRKLIFPHGTDIALVPLSQGKYATIDRADADFIGQWNWCAQYTPDSGSFYAIRGSIVNGVRKTLGMHRALLNPAGDLTVDHVNPTMTLDNRRSNLRLATQAEQMRNRRKNKRNKSGFKGVWWAKDKNKWGTAVQLNKKVTRLGYHDTAEKAHEVYCEAARRLHGEFAQLN